MHEHISSEKIIELLVEKGFNFFTSLPCSINAGLINQIIQKYPNLHFSSSGEAEAVAISSGAWLAGKKGVVLCQNSALFDVVGSVFSIIKRFQIPLLFFLSWRRSQKAGGYPLGDVTLKMVDFLELPYCILNQDTLLSDFFSMLLRADNFLSKRESFFFVVEADTFKKTSLKKLPQKKHTLIKGVIKDFSTKTPDLERKEIVCAFQERFREAIYMANEGYAGRYLFQEGHTKANHFYLLPLGYGPIIGLGFSLFSSKKVIIFDGDGSLLMRVGSLAMVGYYQSKTFVHVIFDNKMYESTGEQSSFTHRVDLSNIAFDFGYRFVFKANSREGLKKILEEIVSCNGPCFVHLRIKPSKELTSPLTIDPKEQSIVFRQLHS